MEWAFEAGRETPCQACPIDGLEPLTEDNAELVQLYQCVANQITYDLHLAPILFDRLYPSGEMSNTDFLEILDRMNLVHTTMQRIAKHKAETEKS